MKITRHEKGNMGHDKAAAAIAVGMSFAMTANAEILAMMNYESKSPDSLKALKTPIVPQPRKEGIVIMDVDPGSPNFGNILIDIPLPADLIAHAPDGRPIRLIG